MNEKQEYILFSRGFQRKYLGILHCYHLIDYLNIKIPNRKLQVSKTKTKRLLCISNRRTVSLPNKHLKSQIKKCPCGFFHQFSHLCVSLPHYPKATFTDNLPYLVNSQWRPAMCWRTSGNSSWGSPPNRCRLLWRCSNSPGGECEGLGAPRYPSSAFLSRGK